MAFNGDPFVFYCFFRQNLISAYINIHKKLLFLESLIISHFTWYFLIAERLLE